MTATRPPDVRPPTVNMVWVRNTVAESAEVVALHRPDDANRCVRCVRMGLCYHGSPATWPCGPYDFAEEQLRRYDPTGALRRELAKPST